jgi:sterol desaturase/sphingolipid hydroxylase (fatty acid hydroxylase superfamily)
MEKYGKILLIIIPIFLVFIVLEKLYGRYIKGEKMNLLDTASSLTSSITMVTKNVLGLSFTILSYQWSEDRVALTHIESTWATYIFAFVVLDFSHYWIHRIEHANNFFWNSHIVHHSSEEFDLACAVRQPISSFVKVFTLFMLPAALLGISPMVIATVTPIQFFAQFWYHTRYINRMGFLEHLIVTPSHHRVHHAFNPEYLDKNMSQIFIIWDKLFGTFQEERADIIPVYGITRPMRTWNPIKINFIHLWLLIQDTWRTSSWKNKVSVWTNPTGWRPADVEKEYPVTKIDDVFNFEKYYIKRSSFFIYWVWIQIAVIFLVTAYLLKNIAVIGTPDIFIYGGFILIYIFALTDFMDGNKSSIIWEIVKACYGISILLFFGDWFGLDHFFAHSSKIIMAYFAISILVTMRLGKENQAEILLPNQRR